MCKTLLALVNNYRMELSNVSDCVDCMKCTLRLLRNTFTAVYATGIFISAHSLALVKVFLSFY